ncbi:5999_t:CDS:1 [Cetraspora pellucida]|uniref:5999_t:CDS:1 n=1 Tax=Cetraspora pellucida TaxID=1433469 RepID=A0A9N9K6U3_9GLOM|nr:5999_t:CDS:1 [Cetraspora pellucida]
MNLKEYVNYLEEKETNEILNNEEILDLFTNLKLKKTKDAEEEENESNKKKNNSTEIHQITHHEALSAVEVLEYYFIQQDVNEVAWLNHDQALSNLQKKIRKLQNSSFKQVDIKAFFELAN